MQCRIGLVLPDNSISTIFCACDAQLSWTGVVLFKNYRSEEIVKQLLDFKSLVCLDFTLAYCVLFADNEMTDLRRPQTVSFEQFSWSGRTYLFMDGEWYFAKSDGKFRPLKICLQEAGLLGLATPYP